MLASIGMAIAIDLIGKIYSAKDCHVYTSISLSFNCFSPGFWASVFLRDYKLSFCLPFFPILGILPSTVFLFLTFYNDIFVGVKGVTALMFYHTLRKDHENTQRLAIF